MWLVWLLGLSSPAHCAFTNQKRSKVEEKAFLVDLYELANGLRWREGWDVSVNSDPCKSSQNSRP